MGWFSGSKPKIKQLANWNPQQQQVSGQIGSYLQGQLSGQPGYTGINLGKLTPLEMQTQGMLEKYLSGTDPITATSENLLQEMMTGTGSQALNAPTTQSYLENVLYAPIRKQLEEEILPSIGASYGKGGSYFSTARAGAETKARQETESGIGKIGEEIAYNELQQQKQNQLSAMTTGLQYPAGKIQMGMQYGGAERTVAQQYQEMIMNQIQNYLKQQPYQYMSTGGSSGLAGPLGSLAGGLLGSFVMPGIGTMLGSQLGGAAGSAMSGGLGR